MGSIHETIVANVIVSWSVDRRGRLYTMQQGLMTPWGSDNPIWIGPYPGKRTKGFPDIFGYVFQSFHVYNNYQYKEIKVPVYCVVEVKTIAYPALTPEQIDYLNYAVSVGGRGYVAREDNSYEGYRLEKWVPK